MGTYAAELVSRVPWTVTLPVQGHFRSSSAPSSRCSIDSDMGGRSVPATRLVKCRLHNLCAYGTRAVRPHVIGRVTVRCEGNGGDAIRGRDALCEIVARETKSTEEGAASGQLCWPNCGNATPPFASNLTSPATMFGPGGAWHSPAQLTLHETVCLMRFAQCMVSYNIMPSWPGPGGFLLFHSTLPRPFPRQTVFPIGKGNRKNDSQNCVVSRARFRTRDPGSVGSCEEKKTLGLSERFSVERSRLKVQRDRSETPPSLSRPSLFSTPF